MKKALLKRIPPPEISDKAKLPSGWSLYGNGPKSGLSQTMIQKFIVCRERFRIRYVEGLISSGGVSDAIEFGNIFHKAWELHCKGVPLKAILNKLTARHPRTREAVYDPHLCKIAVTLLPIYLEYTKEDTKDFHYLRSEQKFNMPYQCGLGRIVHMKGKRDAELLRDGKLWLKENKTKSQINVEQLTHTLPYFVQPGLYLLSLQRDYPEYDIGGFIYDVVRKPGLKRKKNETEVQFLRRIRDDVESRPEHYFLMLEIDMDTKHLEEWRLRFFDPVISQICLWWESIKHNPFDPWTTPSGNIGLSGTDPQVLVQNPHHFLRPFGIYDPLATGVGDYFLKIVNATNAGLVETDEPFPELDDDEE